ncbi:hypothetical protein PV11_02879 [Exophiala sideris]|uniref:Gem-associated protein 5 TPR domain-containing protein n=1 Tax=Exophiala sideris TaxID=1016849 RepID=A0A0D1WES4_9EURO|nr:hypothetical protein PV11_02879 [Exophiala sideris]
MSASVGIARQRSVSNKAKGVSIPLTSQPRPHAEDTPLEPCASTASLFLYAQGSAVLCLHHDTLAVERRFEKHSKDIQLISADNVSETGAGRLVVTYDVGQTAIVWDLFTGEQYSRFVSYESLRVAHWMRNGNIAFGNAKGEVILFEPSTSDHISARTIFDPITAIAPSSDCKTYAIGYNNGSILLAALQPSFTIIHTLTTSRGPSPIVNLTWHASSSKQKSDMLATQTADGDLRIWSVSKPPTAEPPRVIRVLKRSDVYLPGRNWISWSKNGRIVQYSEGKTWAWDVRTKHVTYEPIQTIEGVRAVACHGSTGTLFTLGPDYTVQQYDVEGGVLVANVRHIPTTIPPTPPEDKRGPLWTTSESEEEVASPLGRARRELRAAEAARLERNNIPSPQSTASSHKSGIKPSAKDIISPAGRTDYTTTSIDTGVQSHSMVGQQVPQGYQPQSPTTTRTNKKGSRLRQEVIMSPEERPVVDLFPFTRARLHDVQHRPPMSMDESMSADDLRRHMLSVVFGWDEDIYDLIRDELSRHPSESQNAIFLARWLNEDPDYLAEIMGLTPNGSKLDWMLLALGTISNQVGAKKITQVFIEKLLGNGDVHAAATLMFALGDRSDAIEVYVSNNQYLEAVLLTCLAYPDDWQRQSYLVRKWGEHVVENSQQSLAIRCFACTGVEPSDIWTSPKAQVPTQTAAEIIQIPQMPQLQQLEPMEYPAIFQRTLERRRTLDAPTPVAMPPPHIMSSMPAPPTPYRNAAAQGTRITPQTSALKLITSFEAPSSNQFKFPGLKPDDRTPTVGAAVTPIAESAVDRSALSPGGLGSYRLNNIRSINSALSAKTATPGGFQPSRLPSIGETPVDVEAPQFPTSIPPRSVSVPMELSSIKETQAERLPSGHDAQQNGKPGLTLLTSARYEPVETPVKETPQTAVGPQTAIQFPGSSSHLHGRLNEDAGGVDTPYPRTDSRSRKPEGLSIQTIAVQQVEKGQGYLPPIGYNDPISRPGTTGTYSNTQMDTSGDLTSPPTTGRRYRDAKSPVVAGKSIDHFISSLDQAQYYETHSRARGYSSASKQSKDSQSEKKQTRPNNIGDGGDRDVRRTIPAANRSPSSPVPMSPEDIRMYSTSVESFDSMYSSNVSGYDRAGTPGSMSKLSRRGSQSTTKGTKHRHRSRSKTQGHKSKTGSRVPSRQPSPDQALFSPRGRSSSRKENLGHRSPSSPKPMIPSEEDLQSRFDKGSSMRLVSRDRHRLHRSTSRQPELRDTSSRRDPSPDRRRARARSRSRQAEEASLSRKTSRSERHRRHRHQSDAKYDRSAQPDDPEDSLPGQLHTHEDPRPASQPQFLQDVGRKESAAEQLAARRQSLTRRPSVPHIPLPSQNVGHAKSASTSNVPPPLMRAQTDGGPVMKVLSNNLAPETAMPSHSTLRGRPGTPKAMQLAVETILEAGNSSSAGAAELLSASVYRPPTREDIVRPGSAPAPAPLEFLSQIPKHPLYDHRIGNSRSSSKGAEARASSRSRGTSHERPRVSPREPPALSAAPTGLAGYTSSPPPRHPPILPELQHLAAIPPPPPPPPLKPVLSLASPNFSSLRGFEADAANVPLPMSAVPTSFSEAPTSGIPLSAASLPTGHRRERSGYESSNGGNGSGSNQLFGKLRNFAGRVRSPSRGRRGDDNQAMSPRMDTEQIAPYESIPSAMTSSAG